MRTFLQAAASLLVLSTATAAISTGKARAAAYTFSTFDVPGSKEIFVGGINDLDQVVGTYVDSSNMSHSFVDTAGKFVTINGPGSNPSTSLSGINDVGQLVGTNMGGSSIGGFIYSMGNFTNINFSGQIIVPQAINNLGQVTGYFPPFVDGGAGFIDTAGSFVTISSAGISTLFPSGINDAGQVVGTSDARGTGGKVGVFLYAAGMLTTVDVLGAAAAVAGGINDAGQIVGSYSSTIGSASHAFVDTAGSFATIDVPGAAYTAASGINNLGQVVGTYQDGTGVHGFIATPVPEPASIVLLGTGLAFIIGLTVRPRLVTQSGV